MKFDLTLLPLTLTLSLLSLPVTAEETQPLASTEACTVVLINPATFETMDRIHAATCDDAYKRCLSEITTGLECYRQ